MKSLYDITPDILKLVASISGKIGEINANLLNKPSPRLQKQNRIKTIFYSLKMKGNMLTEKQIEDLVDSKPVVAAKKDIFEIMNAIELYDHLEKYHPYSEKSFLMAHKALMKGLIINPGEYRKQSTGVVNGKNIKHYAPPFQNVPSLMDDLFKYLKNKDELNLIKSCVFHYEIEFIHPFLDGNGRMGRLWQTLILKEECPLFEFVSLESLISSSQHEYFKALSESDKTGKSTAFIEYMLKIIERLLNESLTFRHRTITQTDRLSYFMTLNKNVFTRKDYMNVFKNISSATASRDLAMGLKAELYTKAGEKNKTKYKMK